MRNDAHTPPRTAVSDAPAAESASVFFAARTISAPELASYSIAAAPATPPRTTFANETYKCRRCGSVARSVATSPGGTDAFARTRHAVTSSRSRVRFDPIQTLPAGPATTATRGYGAWRCRLR